MHFGCTGDFAGGEKSYLVAVRQVAVPHHQDQRLRFVLEYFLRNETGRSHVLEK